MKPYWNEFMNPRPGLGIQEGEKHYDNVYIKDQTGRVWQIWIDGDHPLIQLIGHE